MSESRVSIEVLEAERARNILERTDSSLSASEDESLLVSVEGLSELPQPRKCDPVITPSYSIPIVNAGLSSVKVALGLVEKRHNYKFICAVTGTSFLVSAVMNLEYTMAGIKHTVYIIRRRQFPAGWVAIPKTREGAALTLAVTTAVLKSGTDGILNRYFTNRLPVKFNFSHAINLTGWEVLGWTMFGFTVLGTLTSGGMAVYEKTRNILGGKRSEYSNCVSRFVSPPIGVTLSLTYAFVSFCSTFLSVSKTFNVESIPGLIGVSALSAVNVATSQFIAVPQNIRVVDNFFGAFTPEAGETPFYRDPYAIIAAAAALGAGGLTAYSSQGLTGMILNHSLETIGVNCTSITDPVIEGVSYMTVVCNVAWVSGALMPLLYKATESIGGALSRVYNNLSCCRRQTKEVVEVDDEVSEEGYSEFEVSEDCEQRVPMDDEEASLIVRRPKGSASRLFAPRHQDVDREEVRTMRCHIL